jgi:hypothetical protein
MKRWGIALAAGVLLGIASQGRAQVPTGGNGLTYVPINMQNLATPIPAMNIQKPPTFRDHVHAFFRSHLPSFLQPRSPLPGPMMPTTQLPTMAQSNVIHPLQPTTSFPNLPQLPPVVSGQAR